MKNEIVWSSDDEYKYSICSSCDTQVPNWGWEPGEKVEQPVGGLHLAIYTGYEMFTDLFLDEHKRDQALTKLMFCHDCSVKFVSTMLNDHFRSMFSGGHPVSICEEQPSGKPCEYSWSR